MPCRLTAVIERGLGRRALIVGAGAVTAAAAAGAVGVEQGVLPGRPWVQAHLGLNGPAGVVPDVAPGPVVSGSFVSEHRLGAETGWSLLRPPGRAGRGALPLVVALHGLGEDHATLVGPRFGLDRFLAAAVRRGVPPFAIATVDGGTSYWHRRADGEDASAMVVDELLPVLAEQGVRTGTFGLIGWSMGGYGALHLAGSTSRVPVVVASSPALWTDPADASRSGFADEEEYRTYTVVGHQADLDGVDVRIDCGTGDPFYRDVQDYVAGFPDGAGVTSTFEPGAHDAAYWRRMLPAQLAFLGQRLPRDT